MKPTLLASGPGAMGVLGATVVRLLCEEQGPEKQAMLISSWPGESGVTGSLMGEEWHKTHGFYGVQVANKRGFPESWGSPQNGMDGFCEGKSHLELDDFWGYPYFRKPTRDERLWFYGFQVAVVMKNGVFGQKKNR